MNKHGTSFTSMEQQMLHIIKSLQLELIRVAKERDEYHQLLLQCTEQIQGIIQSQSSSLLQSGQRLYEKRT